MQSRRPGGSSLTQLPGLLQMHHSVSTDVPAPFVVDASNDACSENLKRGKLSTGGLLIRRDISSGYLVDTTFSEIIRMQTIAQT